ncbi:hypothetical protein CCR94_11340 [Rhodoblastus sphagnicola]|uniref:Uncharacterized protein n=1 Tax=Rhodoblastus sphagnicola TaxID=333368 RepID=A0A2S6N865_9HYPH|nr:hypothetical protein [Rhodoblastus sphagnicola]MBB4201055.1 hypothetical protein [Rhodoblastus sphagnicola]PPQ30799.1 hypothetical protein CCR94_11340 [Rhodoblastus sphagnicola]
MERTAQSPTELHGQAVRLADKYKENFVDLGVILRKLKADSPDLFKQVYMETKLSYRKALYLVEIARRTADLPISREQLAELGWTKVQAIGAVLTDANCESWLAEAQNHTAEDLKDMVAGKRVIRGARNVTLRLAPKDHERFIQALLAHGAVQKNGGVKRKEEAIINIIAKLEKANG